MAVDPASLRGWPQDFATQFTSDLKIAAVLVPLLERRSGVSLLLTRRAKELKHHAGQISFPGGRMEAGDRSIEETALRETHEEVGIGPHDVRLAGYLDTMPTVTGYAVTPVVGFVDGAAKLTLDPVEVERAFEVPLAFLFDAGNERWSMRRVQGHTVPVAEFRYGGERIWGATASMIIDFQENFI